MQPNKAIVGRNAFAHEAGIHQDGMLKDRRTYEIMDAESSVPGPEIVLGKHSGRHALRQAFADLGFTIEGDDLKRAFHRFKEIADRKQRITSLDLEAIASDSLREREDNVRAGSRRSRRAAASRLGRGRPSPTARASVPPRAGGDGPVDGGLQGDRPPGRRPVALVEYTIGAVSGGADALGEVRVVVECGGHSYASQAVSTDVTEASAEAYLRACAHARSRPNRSRTSGV